jgi:uncharacterized Zn finger protein (UPF0148 family)
MQKCPLCGVPHGEYFCPNCGEHYAQEGQNRISIDDYFKESAKRKLIRDLKVKQLADIIRRAPVKADTPEGKAWVDEAVEALQSVPGPTSTAMEAT